MSSDGRDRWGRRTGPPGKRIPGTAEPEADPYLARYIDLSIAVAGMQEGLKHVLESMDILLDSQMLLVTKVNRLEGEVAQLRASVPLPEE